MVALSFSGYSLNHQYWVVLLDFIAFRAIVASKGLRAFEQKNGICSLSVNLTKEKFAIKEISLQQLANKLSR